MRDKHQCGMYRANYPDTCGTAVQFFFVFYTCCFRVTSSLSLYFSYSIVLPRGGWDYGGVLAFGSVRNLDVLTHELDAIQG